jgi:hypothetical protein
VTTPKFRESDAGVIAGINWRVRRGVKSPDDLVLDFAVGGSWVPVPMILGFFLADFFVQNENRLYRDGRGGKYYLDAVKYAVRHGWQRADAVLQVEKRLKRIGTPQTELFDEDAA